jgi:cold shock CspA family protein
MSTRELLGDYEYGQVTTRNVDRGFCFIKSEYDGAAYFAHATSFAACELPAIGDTIKFRPTLTEKGRRATDCQIVGLDAVF